MGQDSKSYSIGTVKPDSLVFDYPCFLQRAFRTPRRLSLIAAVALDPQFRRASVSDSKQNYRSTDLEVAW